MTRTSTTMVKIFFIFFGFIVCMAYILMFWWMSNLPNRRLANYIPYYIWYEHLCAYLNLSPFCYNWFSNDRSTWYHVQRNFEHCVNQFLYLNGAQFGTMASGNFLKTIHLWNMIQVFSCWFFPCTHLRNWITLKTRKGVSESLRYFQLDSVRRGSKWENYWER